jgi:hypothetical protein
MRSEIFKRARVGCVGSLMLAAAAVLGVGPSAHAGVSVNFNGGATDYTNNFSQNHDGTPQTNFVFGAAAGVKDQPGPSAGGGLTVTGPGVDDTSVYNQMKWTLSDGQVHTVSTMVTAVSGLGSGDKAIQLGFLSGPNSSFNGEDPPNNTFPNLQPTAFLSARLLGNNHIEFQTKASPGGAAAAGNATPTGTINVGDFLRVTLSAQETNTATGAFALGYTLEDLGPDGTAAPVTNATGTLNITIASLANIDLYSGFRTGTPTPFTGTLNFDNFAVTGNGTPTPEPGVIGLLGLGGIAAMVRRRR